MFTDERMAGSGDMGLLNRRPVLIGAAAALGALTLGGCATVDNSEAMALYGPVDDKRFKNASIGDNAAPGNPGGL